MFACTKVLKKDFYALYAHTKIKKTPIKNEILKRKFHLLHFDE